MRPPLISLIPGNLCDNLVHELLREDRERFGHHPTFLSVLFQVHWAIPCDPDCFYFLPAGPSQVVRYHLCRGRLMCRMISMFHTSKGLAKSRFANVWFVQCRYDWDGRAVLVCYHLACLVGWIVDSALSTVVGRNATVKTNAMPRYYETLCLRKCLFSQSSTFGPLQSSYGCMTLGVVISNEKCIHPWFRTVIGSSNDQSRSEVDQRNRNIQNTESRDAYQRYESI